MMNPARTFFTLFRTEAKLSIRGGDMLLFGIVMPVGIMLLVGFISSPETVRSAFSGVACVGICAAGFMGIPLTLSGYRYEKILKRYKVTPVSPGMLLAADMALQLMFAAVSSLLVWLTARFLFGVQVAAAPRFILMWCFSVCVIFSLGACIGAVVPNTKMANVVTSLIYFPSLFLSGATVPYAVMPSGLKAVAQMFPMTQAIRLLDNAVSGSPFSADVLRFVLLAVIAFAAFATALKVFKWE